MAKFTVAQHFNDPHYLGIRERGDVLDESDDTPDDDDTIGKQRVRYFKEWLRRGLVVEGELSKEDLDKRDEEARRDADEKAKKAGDGSEPQTTENVENEPTAPKAPADDLLAPGVAAKDVPGGEKKLAKGREATKADA